MATIKIRPRGGLERLIRKFEQLESQERRIQRRALSRARRDLSRLYVQRMKSNIRRVTKRDTGALLKVRTITRLDSYRPQLSILPTFPATAYETPAGIGRPDAAKRGQYAFVVNASRQFIERTSREIRTDPAVTLILQKHYLYIINQVLRGR